MDIKETKQVSITLPIAWIKTIDKKTTVLKSRQDLIRECIQQHIIGV